MSLTKRSLTTLPQVAKPQKEVKMFNRMFKMSLMGHAASMLAVSGTVFDSENEGLGIIELDQSLADVEKPLELPAGLYTGEIQDVQIGVSQKGNRYFAVKFVVPPDEISADIADQFEDGAALYYNRVVVPDGKDRRQLFNLRKFVEALGLDSNTTQIDPNEWMGCRARLKVTQDTWQGETRAQIKSVESAEGKPAAKAAAATDNKRAARGRK